MSGIEGNWIRQNRVRLGLTLAEVADYAGISKAHLSLIETNVSRPSVPVLYHLASMLDEGELALKLWPLAQAKPAPVKQPEGDTLF